MYMKVKAAHSCLTLCFDPINYTVHGILQARLLEWVACPFSWGIFPTQGLNAGLPYSLPLQIYRCMGSFILFSRKLFSWVIG